MKLTHKLFHRMTNRSCKLQGCSLIYTGMAKDLDVPVLLLTLGIKKTSKNIHKKRKNKKGPKDHSNKKISS